MKDFIVLKRFPQNFSLQTQRSVAIVTIIFKQKSIFANLSQLLNYSARRSDHCDCESKHYFGNSFQSELRSNDS